METIMEILFELILEGSLEASMEKKVPLPVRIIAAAVLIGVFGGLIGFCFYCGIHDGDGIMLVLAFVILVITVLGARAIYRKRRKQ